MLADPILRYADIQACCACLGFREGSVYKIDADAEASVRTLLRYLRNENHECDVRRELGRLKIVSSDLIPLLRSCTGNRLLVELVIRLLMNLTQPAIVCFRQEIPKDRDLYGAYVQVDDLLKSYKKDFADEELFRVLCNLVGELLDRKWEERSEDDRLLIERVLILTRNVLHIAPDPTEERRTDEDVSVHDQLLWALHLSGWDELLLFLGNAEDEHMFAFHTLEIISLMLREQTPDLLAFAGKRTPELMQMSEITQRCWAMENAEKRQSLRQLCTRQNRFGGTYELYNTPSLSNRPLIYHHNVTSSMNSTQPIRNSTTDTPLVTQQFEDKVGIVDLDIGKRVFRKPKSRKPLIERSVHRRSILAVQLFLQNFCWQFLQFCYNPLMRAARASLTRHATQENDETYYLWSMRFFMAFCRLFRFRSALLSETLSASTFHWIYDQVMHYREVMLSDKRGGGTNRKAIQASRRLELSVAAYREFLTCLGRMIKTTEADHIPDLSTSETQDIVEERLRIQSTAAESIMANVFYVSEYQEVFPMLLKDFNEAIQSSETLSASTFHWIYDQVMHYREVMLSDKRGGGTNRKAIQASRRLELSVAAYREFLTCLGRMIKTTEADHIPDLSTSETQDIVEERLRIQSTAAESIMANVFYVSEYQEVFPMLLKDFNEAIQSRLVAFLFSKLNNM
ncbi:hypothetical protein AHF37_02922 [Paragonimus kellicotti]|nr:hypothetical protein AHF37_02922 [Paragonimus kellicotti]